MSDPGTTRPFSPAELDAIEDALDQLHGEDPFVVAALPDEGAAIVRERLASYRAISRLSRDVLRSYEAPAHVLDRVNALARESGVVTQSPAPATTEAAAPTPSFWKRIHAAWTVPVFATVVAAGVVAIVVLPTTQRSSERASDLVAANEPAPPAPSSSAASAPAEAEPASDRGRLAMAEPNDGEDEMLEAQRGSAALAEEKSAKEADAIAPEGRASVDAKRRDKAIAQDVPAAEPTTATPKSPSRPSPKPKADAASGTKGGGGAPGTVPPPSAKNEDGEKDTDELARADALRKSGDCDAAVKLYESVRKRGTKKQRARALVGLALCAERGGDRDRAADLLSQARADDAEIDAYYDSQR